MDILELDSNRKDSEWIEILATEIRQFIYICNIKNKCQNHSVEFNKLDYIMSYGVKVFGKEHNLG